MGIVAEAVTSNQAAMSILNAELGEVRAVISDIAHDDGSPDGLALLGALRSRPSVPPVIFYVMQVDGSKGTPAGAFGITERPDVLLNLVMDALDR